MKNNLFDLSGQVAFCCGGSSGLGLQFAKAMANAGADIALVARRTDRLDENAREIEAEYGVKVYPHYMDLQDSKSITDCVSDVVILARSTFWSMPLVFRAAATRPRSRTSTGSTSSTPTSMGSSSPAARSCASP